MTTCKEIKSNIEHELGNALADFSELTGCPYNPHDGYRQVPTGNDAAQRAYGRIDALETLLLDLF